MKLPHALSARQFAKQFSKLVNGLAEMTWRSTTSYPSTPQNFSMVGVAEGEVVDDEVVSSDEVEVTEISEDMLDETEMEEKAEDSMGNDELEEVLSRIVMVGVKSGVELEAALLEVEGRSELEEVLLELELSRELVEELEEAEELEELGKLEVEEMEVEALLEVEVLLEEDGTALHFPNPGWQPFPQCALELPQYEYWEQQSPYLPPVQVIPAGDAPCRFPQRAFVVTLTFTVEEGVVVGEAVRVEVLQLEVFEVCVGTAPLQVPNDDWQPVPQYSLAFPLQEVSQFVWACRSHSGCLPVAVLRATVTPL